MLSWFKATGILLGSVFLGLGLLALNAIVSTEAVARTYFWSERLVELQVRRLAAEQQQPCRSAWLGLIAECRERAYPGSALFRAFVTIPRLCRGRLRAAAAAEREEPGEWRPWTRTGRYVHRSANRVFDAILKASIRGSIVAHNGRINWSGIPQSTRGLSPEDCEDIFRDPSVIRASLFTEADALENQLRSMAPDDEDRPVMLRAYRQVIDLLRAPEDGPISLLTLVEAKEAVLPAAVALREIRRRKEAELRRRAEELKAFHAALA